MEFISSISNYQDSNLEQISNVVILIVNFSIK